MDTIFPLPPDIKINSPFGYCHTGNFVFDATWPGATYTWNNGDTSPSINNPPIGNYWVDITNVCGTQRLNIQFRPHPCLNLNLPNDTIRCVGDFFNYSLGIVPTQFDSLFWNNQKHMAPVHPALPRQTVVSVYNACGIFTDTAFLSEIEPPSFDFPEDTAICPNDSIEIVPNGNFTFRDSFLWPDGFSDSNWTIVAQNSQNIELTIQNICGALTKSFFLQVHPIPLLELPDSIHFCSDSSMVLHNLNNLADTVLWNQQVLANSFKITQVGFVVGEISNPCKLIIDSTFVDIDSAISFSFPFSEKAFCEGDSVLLNADVGKANYIWSNGDRDKFIYAKQPGIFRIAISNLCGTVSDSVLLEFVNKPLPVQPTQVHLCSGDSINFDLVREFIVFEWSDANHSHSRTFYLAGTIGLMAYNHCGDTLNTSIQIASFTPADSIDFSFGVLNNLYDNGNYYRWFNDGLQVGEGRSFIPTQDGLYFLNYLDEYGCEQ